MTPWEADVAVAMSEARAGRGNQDVARVLAAEVTHLRDQLIDKLAEELKRCPVCGVLADSVVAPSSGPVRYQHGEGWHLGRVSHGG
jgi:hypothetical protein